MKKKFLNFLTIFLLLFFSFWYNNIYNVFAEEEEKQEEKESIFWKMEDIIIINKSWKYSDIVKWIIDEHWEKWSE